MIKSTVFRITFVAILIVLLTPSIPLLAKEGRIALVIGNGVYKSAPLKNTVNDARDIADALRNLGFIVILKTNADQKTMEVTIREFGKKLRSGGVGLFYFAGHGLQVKGRNYLLPIGADIESEADVKYETVDSGRVLAQMEEAENGLNIIILDACRGNPFARSFRSNEKGLAKMDAPEGSILAYATGPGSVAAEGPGRNGLYTSKLLKHIRTPGLPVELFFKEVRRDVRNASGKKQIPWTESSLVGDFYFNTKRGIAIVESPSTKTKSSVKETPKHTSISPGVTKPKVIDSDKHFIKYYTGIVYDTRTGLEWYTGPNKDTNYIEAESWIKSLDLDGGPWRMPTVNELKALYKRTNDNRRRPKMSPLFENTGERLWSGDPASGHPASSTFKAIVVFWSTDYDFAWVGGAHIKVHRSCRVFAVRSRK